MPVQSIETHGLQPLFLTRRHAALNPCLDLSPCLMLFCPIVPRHVIMTIANSVMQVAESTARMIHIAYDAPQHPSSWTWCKPLLASGTCTLSLPTAVCVDKYQSPSKCDSSSIAWAYSKCDKKEDLEEQASCFCIFRYSGWGKAVLCFVLELEEKQTNAATASTFHVCNTRTQEHKNLLP
jgi:hypothetical protein